jgi:hypothetical protein
MHWVTKPDLYLDRVASPWLIVRFVDVSATFGFIETIDQVPKDAMPFAIAGAKLGPHDAQGSTFRKVLQEYRLESPELLRLAECVEDGIAVATGQPRRAIEEDIRLHGSALASFSEGMAVLTPDDNANIRKSIPHYDALYVELWSRYGPAPTLETKVRDRINAMQAAKDWSTLFPDWPVVGEHRRCE